MVRLGRLGRFVLAALAVTTLIAVQPVQGEDRQASAALPPGAGGVPAPSVAVAQRDTTSDTGASPALNIVVEPAELTTLPGEMSRLPQDSNSPALPGRQSTSAGMLATTLINEGFESTWPAGSWSVWYFGGNQSNATWGRTTYRKSSGSYSIWCAAGGSGAVSAGSLVPVNTSAGAIIGPLDLSSATSGSFAFDLWLQTEANVDKFWWLAEVGCDPNVQGCTFNGYTTTTNTSGFQRLTQDLANWGSAGSLVGKSNVWIALVYSSDYSMQFEGAYLDNVSLTVETGGGGSQCGTYVVTEDNDNNAWGGVADGDWGYCLYKTDAKHPIEFHIDITETSITSAQLLLLCNDVDEDTVAGKPEVDKVYVNDYYVGDLTGANDQDSTTLLTIPANYLRTGRNKIRIDVNTDSRSAPDEWCVQVKQAQLIINGGCQGTASCRSVTTDKANYSAGNTVVVTYEIDTSLASQEVRVESNLVAPGGNIVAGSEKTYTTSDSQNDPQSVSLALPSGAASGTYTAEVLVFDKASGRLDKRCQATFTVGSSCSLTCTATVPTTGQVGQAISFTSTSSATGCTGTAEYFWTFGDGTTAVAQSQNTTYTYNTPGTYTWNLTVILGSARCEKTGTITITQGGCTLTCTATVPTTGQVGQAISFTSTSSATGCTGTAEYFWTFGDGTTAVAQSQNTTYTYNTPGTYTWNLTVILGSARCEKSGTITISQGGGTACTVNCTAVVPTTAIVGQSVSFQGSATTSNCSGTPQYFWTFGDGTTAVAQSQNTTFTYNAPGTYTWELFVIVGNSRCVRTGTIVVSRSGSANCSLGCDAVVPTTAAVGATITFQGSATLTNCSGTPDYFWTFGDGTTAVAQGRVVTASYDMPGTYTWELSVVLNGILCVRRGTITITGGATGCSVGCSAAVPAVALVNQQVQFFGSATATNCSGTPEYFWFFGDGTTAVAQAQNTWWTYTKPGTYTWEFMVVVDGVWCRRSGTITVISGAGCGLNCAALVPDTIQVGQSVSFRGFANWSNCTTTPNFLWDFGDMTMPSGGVTTTHVYQAPGSYWWQLTVMVDGVYCVRSGVIIVTTATQTAACRYSQWFQVGTQATGIGANWRTDVSILNPTASTAQLQLRLHTASGIKTLASSLGPGRHITMANVVGQMGYNGSGGLQLCSDQPVRASSRTYNQATATTTYGQYYGPYNSAAAVAAGDLAWLPGLRQDSAFRTNIALTNSGATNALVAVSLYNGDGTRLGGYLVTLTPGEWRQQTQVFQTYAGRNDISSGYARVAVLAGTGIIVSASVIDNATGDAATNPWLY